jgi:hypothetical protein
MTWDEADTLKELIEKLESGGKLTNKELMKVLLILMKDAREAFYSHMD